MGRASFVATYRLQLTPAFTLRDAAEVVPYLADLGISHVYTSSYLQAASGSTHGYDVVDPTIVNVELGGEDALAEFQQALAAHGLGNVVDVVPNHMATGNENPYWQAMLADGEASDAARCFDVDWHAPEVKLHGKVLLAVLGDSYADELRNGTLRVEADGDHDRLCYHDHVFPLTGANRSAGEYNADPALLHELLERQHYRLACWRVGRDELNYRRFFEVDTLAGVRVEDDDVFETVHRRTLEWVADGTVQGLRIDHPDGLRDPTAYLQRLREAAPDAWIVVEKILEPGEDLPASWPVDGTTGYDAMQRITAVFVAPGSEREMTSAYAEFCSDTDYHAVVHAAKVQVVRDLLTTEVTRLTDIAARLCEQGVRMRDVSRRALRTTIEAMLIAMPVYRTYAIAGSSSADDDAVLREVVDTVATNEPKLDLQLVSFLAGVVGGSRSTADGSQDFDDSALASAVLADDFAARFQQLSGPVMAKGVEDTTFYRHFRLLALNEVGSDPSVFGSTIEAFHEANLDAALHHPLAMTSTSTHDTKRSEDVRATIALLAEVPDAWRVTTARWKAHNVSKWNGAHADHNIEYLVYQTLVGAHPLPRERLHEFLGKAMREAKQGTSWLQPNEAYESSVHSFVDALYTDDTFTRDLDDFASRLRRAARVAALNQLLLKATIPGIPDFYQGCELWTSSLVDPDNRTPVDYDARRELVASLADAPPGEDIGVDALGTTKLWLTRRLLALRCEHSVAFVGDTASYVPVLTTGDRCLAFTRGGRVLVVAGVRPAAIDHDGWAGATIDLPAGIWTDALGSGRTFDGTVDVVDIATTWNLAVLTRNEE